MLRQRRHGPKQRQGDDVGDNPQVLVAEVNRDDRIVKECRRAQRPFLPVSERQLGAEPQIHADAAEHEAQEPVIAVRHVSEADDHEDGCEQGGDLRRSELQHGALHKISGRMRKGIISGQLRCQFAADQIRSPAMADDPLRETSRAVAEVDLQLPLSVQKGGP